MVVLVLWLLALGGLHVLQSAFGGTYSDDFDLSGTQSSTGADLLRAHDPAAGGTGAQVVLHDAQKPLTDVSDQVGQVVGNLEKLPHVLSAQNPLPSSSSASSAALSKDGKTAYITVRFDVNPTSLDDSYLDQVDTAVKPLRSAGVQVEYGGPLGELARPETKDFTSEAIGFAVAVVVLLIGFGSVIAAGMPLITALIAVIVGVSCLGLLAALTTFASVSPTLATMIGLGVGIDYALFLITRHRQLVMDGDDPVRAAGRAVATSGRAVLVSGCTVVVALAGLYVSRVTFIGKLGAAAAVTVVTAVLGALTLVPALLGLVGRRIDRFRVRPPVAEGGAGAGVTQQGGWHRYARRVERRPWWFLVAGAVVVGVLAIPLFSIRLGHIDDGADPTSFTDRRAFDLVSSAFGPGANGPLTLVVDQRSVPDADRSALASNLKKALTDVPGAASVSALQPTSDDALLVGTAVPKDAPQDAGTTDLFKRLKDDALPEGVSGTAASGYVTGTTAAQEDFLAIIAARLPGIIAVVVGLAFLIILIVFRGCAGRAEGRRPQPPLDRRLVRGGGGGLPVGLGWTLAGRVGDRTDRELRPDDDVRHRLRAEHGLRGVPDLPGARGVAAHPGQPGRGGARPGDHGPGDHLRRADHGERLRGVHPQRRHRGQDAGPGPRGQRADRRHGRTAAARPGRDDAAGAGGVAVAEVAGPGAAAHRHGGLRRVFAYSRRRLQRRERPVRVTVESGPTSTFQYVDGGAFSA